MKKQKKQVEVVNEKEVPAKIIADSIVEISKAMRVINTTRLTRKAIVTLIHEQSKIARRDIEIVMNNLDSLEQDWLK